MTPVMLTAATVLVVTCAGMLVWIWLRRKSIPIEPVANRLLAVLVLSVFAIGVARYIWVGGKVIDIVTVRSIDDGREAIIFFHGWTGTDATWVGLIDLAKSDSRLVGFDLAYVRYPTSLGGHGASVSEVAELLRTSLATTFPKRRLHFVAHSLGGLVARRIALLEALASKGLVIGSMMSAGSPYGGADIAKIGQSATHPGAFYQELATGSLQVRSMDIDWKVFRATERGRALAVRCLASRDDEVVPVSSALSGCGECVIVSGWGHMQLPSPLSTTDVRYLEPIEFVLAHVDGRRLPANAACRGP